MVRSMTTFARIEKVEGSFAVKMEFRSVNHRYLDVHIRIPLWMTPIEEKIRQKVSEVHERGKVDVIISLEGKSVFRPCFKVDTEAVDAYLKAVDDIKNHSGLRGELTIVDLLMLFREAITQEQEDIDIDLIWGFISPELDRLLDAARRQSEVEGGSLETDLRKRIETVTSLITSIEKRKKEVFSVQKEALKQRISAILEDTPLIEDRLLHEFAVLADRLDITEELVRAKSHCKRFLELMDEECAIGRRLDFLLQELFREINTISSKAQDALISQMIVEAKGELEKLREQVQNII